MREIRFRARDVENTRWVYGYYEEIPVGIGKPIGIMHTFNDWNLNMHVEVNPDTVGQYTDLKDKNGKEIYEGDVLQQEGLQVAVRWSEFDAGFIFEDPSGSCMSVTSGNANQWEIIGIIYENPELVS